jgi:hypothetical protein
VSGQRHSLAELTPPLPALVRKLSGHKASLGLRGEKPPSLIKNRTKKLNPCRGRKHFQKIIVFYVATRPRVIVTGVSGQTVGPNLKGLFHDPLKMGPIGCPETSVTTILGCETSQKTDDLIYRAAKAPNHATFFSFIEIIN